MDASARPHRRLIWKYAAVVVTLVAAAVLSVGLTELYFSYQDSKKALTRVERDKASSAATSIEQRMQEILRELDDAAQPTVETRAAGVAEREDNFHRLLERDGFVDQVSYLDSPARSVSASRRWSPTGPSAAPTSPGVARSSARGRRGGISAVSTFCAVPART